MDPKKPISKSNEPLDAIDLSGTPTVDDFIKELEAKEKDLHITADLEIEVSEDEFDEPEVPEFVLRDIPKSGSNGFDQPAQPGLSLRVHELQKEVESLNSRLRSMRAERDDVQEKSDRRLKDFENFKYRVDRERRGAFIEQVSNLAAQMLPVLDNLDRALESAEAIAGEKTAEFQQFYDGIILVNQQVKEIFSGMGVRPILTVGERFDPNFHEAVSVEDRDDMPPNTVTEEMLKGYRIGNRVIRHSMVKVTTSSSKPANQIRRLDDVDIPDEDDLEERFDEIIAPAND